MRRFLVMLAQEIFAEVVLEIAVHSVDVIVVVLCVVVFEQKGGPLDAVVVAFALFDTPRPGKVQLVDSSLVDLSQVFLRQLRPDDARP